LYFGTYLKISDLYLLASIFVLSEDRFIKIKQVCILQVEKMLKSMDLK